MADEGAVAIIGMACRFPGAPDLFTYWKNLREGRESVRRLDTHEIAPELRRLATRPGYVPAVGLVDGVDEFDAAFFGLSTREALLTDPQHRLFLEASFTALEDAGYGDPSRFAGAIGVYGGSWLSSYALRARGHVETPSDEFEALIGSGLDYLTTFVSYKLGLRGESLTVQTACSTSLVAVHLAVQSLLTGANDMAIAGGVSIDARQNAGYVYQEGMIGSHDGRCRPFDHHAAGTVRGYGLGVVVLRRLVDALDAGEPIRAVILGSATNNDGREKIGFTAPSIRGQADVIATALSMADVSGEAIGYVEAHGTGTPLGDPIEIAALTRAFGSPYKNACAIGSVKSNFGHLVEAAGVAGLIKAVLALEHGEIPPTLHFESPNPRLDLPSTPFFVADRLQPFPHDRRLAGVSSFGIGGTNAHVVLAAAPVARRETAREDVRVFPLSAGSPAALTVRRQDLLDWLVAHPDARLDDLALTLAVGRASLPHRHAFVARTREELVQALKSETGDGTEAAQGVNGTPLDPRAAHGDTTELRRLAQAWGAGTPVQWETLAEGGQRARLPTYPFERRRYWLEPEAGGTAHGTAWWLESAGPRRDAARPALMLLDAPSENALDRRIDAVRTLASDGDLDALSAAINFGTGTGPYRAAMQFNSRAELMDVGPDSPWLLRGLPRIGRLAFVFSGQGGHWPGMAQELLEDPIFRRALEAADVALRRFAPASILAAIEAGASAGVLRNDGILQHAVFALQVAVSALWRSWGVEPDAIVGHSLGEVAAAHVAGALSLEDAARVVHERTACADRARGTGTMAFVALSEQELRADIAGYGAALAVAAINDDRGVLLSGKEHAIQALLARLTAANVFCQRLDVDYMAHSSEMEPLAHELSNALAGLVAQVPARPLYSTVTTQRHEIAGTDAAYWGRNFSQGVQFKATVDRMIDDGVDGFLELGPHGTLVHSLERLLEARRRTGVVLPSLSRGEDGRRGMLRAAGALHCAGRFVRWPPEEPSANGSTRQPRSIREHLRVLVAKRLGISVEMLSPDDLFIDLGLQSMAALSLTSQINTQFSAQLSPADLLALGTVARIAERLEGGGSGTHGIVVPLRRASRDAPEAILFPGAGGSAIMMAGWASPELLPGYGVLAINPPGHGSDRGVPVADVARLASIIVSAFESDADRRTLVGFSFGALVAFEVARQLERGGRPPESLVLVHGPAPHAWAQFGLRSDSPAFDDSFGNLYDRLAGHEQSRDDFLAAARADFQAAEQYVADNAKVGCQIHAIASDGDSMFSTDVIGAWRDCGDRVEVHASVGDHFEFLDHPHNRDLLRQILRG